MIEIRKNNDMMTTWAELKDAIRAGSSLLNVGDEIDIELKTGEKVTLVCERVGHRSATFFTKNGEKLSTMEAYLSKVLRVLREKEVFGENKYGKEKVCEALPRYFKKENRIKTLSGIPFPYWLATPYASGSTSFCGVSSDGSNYYSGASASRGVCFGFDIYSTV